ncbi:hypothetical protein, partial [Microbacterium sp. 13-71-7]|uniref:hypothetical protein n=1 Tax=Microbacterium sp. 13-71-7 TaxID=1970399 RepID=UPI000BD5AEE7
MNEGDRVVNRRLLRRELCTARTGPAAVVAVVLLAASIAAVVTAIWTADPSGASVVRDGAAAVSGSRRIPSASQAWPAATWRLRGNAAPDGTAHAPRCPSPPR